MTTGNPDSARRVPTTTQWGSYEAVVEKGRVVAMDPVAADRDPSPIAAGMPGAQSDPVRILEPMVRKGWLEHGPGQAAGGRGSEPFVAVSWDRALELAAGELARVRRDHGDESVYGGSYGWASAGRFHHAQSQVHRFLALGGGYTTSRGSYSVGAMEVILPRVIGGGKWSVWERGPLWEEIADHARLVISFGGLAAKNAQVNPGGVGRHEVLELQRRCAAAGVRFVNVSPQRSDAADFLAAEWLSLRPNTDVALMLGIAHALLAEDLHDRDFLERCCHGWERFAAYLSGEEDGVPKTPAWAERICGVPAARIVALAHEIAAERTVINVSWSVQRQDHGEQVHWAAIALAAMSGSMGRPGGGFAAGLGVTSIGVRPDRQPVAALPQGENRVEAFIPVSRISDMLLSPGETYRYDGGTYAFPDVRLVYWAGGNPFHHQQDLNRLVRAWQRPETVIVHEPWWNPMARHADIVFPAATTLERNDIAAGMNDVALLAMHRAVAPPAAVRTDYEVLAALAERLGYGVEFTEGRSAEQWVEHLYEATREGLRERQIELPPFEEFWAAGSAELPAVERTGENSFFALRDDPDANPLDTPSGRVELFSETIASFDYDDCPGHPTWLEPAEWLGSRVADRFPLHLLSNQPRTRLHSQYDNGAQSRAAKVGGREPLLMHPADAAERGIADGDVVRLFNDRGACLAGAKLSDDLRRGVLVLPTGAWYDPQEPGGLDRHGNPNVLTRDHGTSELAQGPAAQSVLVEAEPFEGVPPTVMAFEPPLVLREADVEAGR
ncbi:MAG: molybdopterin-dependent oxidoreductase [Actinobacteria bacterium]|nr:molybdopterin-dependent oxidoreductase [Actinomycetota bacterium]